MIRYALSKLKKMLWALALAAALNIPSATSVAQVDLLELREGAGVPAEVVAIYSKGVRFLADGQKEDLSLIHI